MIRWILDRNWFSISLYALAIFFSSAGIEILQGNYFGLISSFSVALAVFSSKKSIWFSLLLFPVSSFLITVYSVVPVAAVSALAVAIAVVGGATKGKKPLWLLVSVLASATVISLSLGYSGSLLGGFLGFSASSELVKVNSALFTFALTFFLFLSSWLVGYFLFIREFHIGSNRDMAFNLIRTKKLGLEIAKQNERLEIAKDLSDLLVQRISAVVSVTEGGRYAVASDPDSAKRVLERSYDAGRAAQAELRRLYDYLNSAIISHVASFKIDDLNELAVSFRELGYNTVISSQGQSFRLNEGMELCVYKIVFEALQNVRKHAPIGTEIGVDFLWVEDGLQVLVKDNGIEVSNRVRQSLGEVVGGYDAAEDFDTLVNKFDGATLAALRDRAAIYKGRIDATQVAGVGFTLSAIFPDLKAHSAQVS